MEAYMEIIIKCNEAHAQCLLRALDTYTRLHIGQFVQALSNVNFIKNGKIFASKEIEQLLERAASLFTGRPLPQPNLSLRAEEVHDDARVVYDMKQVLQNKIAWFKNPSGGITIDFNDPDHLSEQPLPAVSVKE
jgi:hypothetical protein